MIFKNKDSHQELIEKLQLILDYNLAPEKAYFISKEITSLKNGVKGEKDAAYFINFYYKHSTNWAVIHDLRIKHKGEVAQIDHILINRLFDFYILESKYFRDKLQINEKGEFTAIYENKKIGIESPLEQNERHIHLFNSFLVENEILPKRLGVMIKPRFFNYILISPKSTIKRPLKYKLNTDNIIKADMLRSTIEKNADNASVSEIGRVLTLSSFDTIAEIATKIVSFHQPYHVNLLKKYGITNKDIVLALKQQAGRKPQSHLNAKLSTPYCPICNSTMVLRTSKTGNKFFGCSTFPKCRGTRDISYQCC